MRNFSWSNYIASVIVLFILCWLTMTFVNDKILIFVFGLLAGSISRIVGELVEIFIKIRK